MFTSVCVALYPGSSPVEKRGGAWVLLLLKESQSDAVELKPYSVNEYSFSIFMTYCYALC